MVALDDNPTRKPKASNQRKVSAQSADRLSFMPEVYPENIGMPSVNSDTSVANHITNGSTDYIWRGNQVMEERNSSNAAVRQYVWGTYPGAAALTGPPAQTGFRPENTGLGSLNVDECVQLTTLTTLAPQSLPAGAYYLLQDLLYRAVALTNSSGTIVEAYDADAYGNTLIFTAPDSGGNWWGDSAVQSNYGANEIIYCGYRFDPETDLYYVRNRMCNPTLGRWIQRDPIGSAGGINLYGYVSGRAVVELDPEGTGGPGFPPPKGKCWTGDCLQNCEIAVNGYVPKYMRESEMQVCTLCVLEKTRANCETCVDAVIVGVIVGKGVGKAVK